MFLFVFIVYCDCDDSTRPHFIDHFHPDDSLQTIVIKLQKAGMFKQVTQGGGGGCAIASDCIDWLEKLRAQTQAAQAVWSIPAGRVAGAL